MNVYLDKIKEFDLNAKQVESIARRISKAALDAEEIGLQIFGGSGHGTLRFFLAETHGPGHDIVADLDGIFDGGDGGDGGDVYT